MVLAELLVTGDDPLLLVEPVFVAWRAACTGPGAAARVHDLLRDKSRRAQGRAAALFD
ncbi:hypothetical protein [Streptomyces sp. NBC_00019]|uniref:hypothetical protein n=1 Tax=Streptomyces sp. NBC_00019 TaxID=2975623 RepID=UPI00324DE87A